MLKRIDTRVVKILVSAATLAYSIYLFTVGQTGSAIGLLFLAAIFILASIQSLRLIMAFAYLRTQKMDEARTWLDRINPKHLWKRRRAYYHFLQGSMSMEKNMNEAERHLKESLSLGLKQDHDKAAAKLNLAVVASAKRRRQEAMALLNECKRLDSKGMLKKDIKMVEQAIKNPQQVMKRGR